MISTILSNIKYSWPKIITTLLLVPFFPLESSHIQPFVTVSIALTLFMHHIDNKKVQVNLSTQDKQLIALNISNTLHASYLFIKYTSNNLLPVNSLIEVDYGQLVNIPLWITCHEILFFYIHRFAHKKYVYSSNFFGHKMHHKFKVTSAWTSFYAHPIDHFVSVLCITLLFPFFQLYYLQHKIDVPIFVLYITGALLTFISSHHVKYGQHNLHGTDHLEHHMLFNYNYGNFGFFDKIYGSYKKKICL